MAEFGISKVTTLPASPAANWIYIYLDPVTGIPSMYITDVTGGALKLVAGAVPSLDQVLGIGNVSPKDIYPGGVFVTDDNNYDNYIDEGGVFANGSAETFFSATGGVTTNASVVGILTKGNPDSNGFAAAVVGMDSSSVSPGSSTNLAGYFGGAMMVTGAMMGLNMQVKNVASSSLTIAKTDVLVLVANGGTAYLPASPTDGETHFIYRSSGTITINGNGHNITHGTDSSTSVSPDYSMILVYANSAWRRFDENH